jgi:hypothetical protein
MSIDPDETPVEDAAAEILKPIDDLIAEEAETLKKANEKIDEVERKSKKVFPEAKRDDEP